ncbi:MAG: TAT-variant-translocated molybdopterin oxidoreductase [Schleiferiaceae bacterium]
MAENKKYWTGFEDLANTEIAQKLKENEFAAEIPSTEFLGDKESLEESNTSRRDFLKYLGFSTAAATLAACESPVVESIPYVVKPDSVIPGLPNYYATAYYDGEDYASILVKTREGRPIKVEPNTDATFNAGTNARVQASVLSLYDSNRLRMPMAKGVEASWDSILTEIKGELLKAEGKEVVLLTSTVVSPSTKALIASFGEQFSNFTHVTYDPYSYSGKLDVYEEVTGERALPMIKMDKAHLVVGVGADFLNGYTGQSVESDYAAARKPGKHMMRHIQVESNLSLTGSNADKRIKVGAAEQFSSLVYLYNTVTGSKLPVGSLSTEAKSSLDGVAKELMKAGSHSLVMVGGNDANAERIALALNNALGNLGTTIDLTNKVYLRAGNDKALYAMIKRMNAGQVGAIITNGVNPMYQLATAKGYAKGLEKVTTKVAFTDRMDESAASMDYVLPTSHAFESWGDAIPATGVYALTQPTIKPLFDTRQFEEALMSWAGVEGRYYDYIKNTYATNYGSLLGAGWNTVLHDGEARFSAEATSVEMPEMDLNAAASALAKMKAGKYQVAFYQKAGVGIGNQTNNPWLHEMPDPVSRVTWDNYVTISLADAMAMDLMNEHESNGALNGSRVNLTANGATLSNVPVLIQPGQTIGTLGLSTGYGRTAAGKAGNGIGVNAFELMNGQHFADVTIEKAEGIHEFASVQLGNTMMGRKIVNETDLSTFLNGEHSEWNEIPMFHTYDGHKDSDETNLWDSFDHETGPMWNMAIDLNSCIGCGACVVACHLENNVPVVGKEEVRNFRDMHWLRIDRYYSSDVTKETEGYEGVGLIGKGATDRYADMEKPAESPEVVFQPVMCQHCNHAPCETVCPVAATSHSAEGLNHMAYNRCIGTRYCANNCPYKVRRFNWFNYQGNDQFADVNPSMDDYGRMVLNPDVTVRARGVMEKCSMCIQRIQLGKLEAKKAGKMLEDGAFTTACAQACGTGSITFGDVNNEKSAVRAAKEDARSYRLLDEVGTQPSVFYQTKIRNKA